MQINDVCKQTGLTKKAVEYYQLKGLLAPKVSENGYREFSDLDVERLKEIALLRKLDLSIDEIKQVLESNNKKHTLASIKQIKELQAKVKLERLELMEQLIEGVDSVEIMDRVSILEQQSSIKEKLLLAFPGYYGRYLSFHFGRFLNEPIKTSEQKQLFDKLVEFLDNIESIEIPEELQSVLDEVEEYMGEEEIEKMSSVISEAIEDFENYWEKNKDIIIQYIKYKQTNEYQSTAGAKIMDLYRRFSETSGYYDVFIPTMRKLSPAYNHYYNKLLEANEKLLKKLPDA